MKLTFQGASVETEASTVGAFLKGRGVDTSRAVVEYRGEVLDSVLLDKTELIDGAELNVFRIVAGG